jgi:hypothetical protein
MVLRLKVYGTLRENTYVRVPVYTMEYSPISTVLGFWLNVQRFTCEIAMKRHTQPLISVYVCLACIQLLLSE